MIINWYFICCFEHNTAYFMFDEPRILYPDHSFFKIFSYHIVEGDAVAALNAGDKTLISQAWQENILVMKRHWVKRSLQVVEFFYIRLN